MSDPLNVNPAPSRNAPSGASRTPTEPGDPPRPLSVTYDRDSDTFSGTMVLVVKLAMRAVQELGWKLDNANEVLGLVTFTTGMTWGSFAGVTGSLNIEEVSANRFRVTGTAQQNNPGGKIVLNLFGEAENKVEMAIRKMAELAARAPSGGVAMGTAEQRERQRQWEAERRQLALEGARLAAQRQRQREELLERQREAQRRWEEQKREALRWGEERSRAALVALVSAARWLLRIGDRVLRGLARRRGDVRVRRVLVSTRWRGRKADRVLWRWSSRLRSLTETGMRRCLWLVLAIVLILVVVVGALVVNGAGGRRPESIPRLEKQDRELESTAAAPGASHRKALTTAQEEQIRLRLQSLYAALYSLPTSGPVDQLPNVMQQEANLRAEISQLEAQLADPAEPKGR